MAKRRLTKQQKRRIDQNISDRSDITEFKQSDFKQGLVISHFGQELEIETNEKEIIRLFQRQNLGTIVTGDQILYSIDEKGLGVIEAILERKSLLERPAPHNRKKAMASNIDQVIIVIAIEPEPISHYIDRYLVAVHAQNLKPLLLLNKIDLDSKNKNEIENLCQLYKNLGYQFISTSALKQKKISTLEEYLNNKTSIFVGQSGVGKSELLNSLFGQTITKVGDISDMNKRGKHTTTSARLYHLPKQNGDIIDSPGIREFGIWHLSEHDILNGFIEFQDYIGHCKFRNCDHQEKTPGCAFVNAVNEGQISQQRFINYHRLMYELKENG